ncbi:uncharacterized protein TrAFT101_007728 [Trichoderma asperellum]|uniref:uncharacterized protein n=1 Tax=Trichoderma asperellum TaxID=101201 RepID=UPI00332F5CA8|nr:hypothetical protein TrAFT101_007728 [Trichoderma asperellum]
MSQAVSNSRSVLNNDFGNNATLHLGDVHHHVSDQANQCLKDLRSTDPRDDKTRIQNTKGGLLKDSYRWILENENFQDWRNNAQNRILWIKGNPGKGKTMLLCGIIDELMPMTKLAQPIDQNNNTILLSYFFCQGTDARINNATAVLRGLIYLILVQEPSLISHVQTRYKHAGKDLFSDVNAWVALSETFVAILQDSKVKEIILIIDALDECETDLPKLLDAVAQQLSFPHVKCIISSRNIPSIQQRLESHIPQGILSLELKENASCVSEAVDAYIKHRVSRLRSIQNNNGLQDQLRKLIQQKAKGTFLWVSLVMKDLEEVQEWDVMEVVDDMPMDLAALYKRMINQIYSLPGRNKKICKSLLSAILTTYYPLGLAEIGVLAGMPDKISANLESITKLVLMCGSFLTLSEDHVYFIHQSAKDFLSAEIYSTDVAQRHLDVFKRSVTAISKLSKNIYCLTDFGPRPKDIQAPNPNPLASMKYSCFYWAYHLCDTCSASSQYEAQLLLHETLEPFLKNHLLRWIESLSLLDGLLEGLRSIRKLLHELPHNKNTQLSGLLSTIEKFMLRNGALIAESPLQVYGSALIFSPMHDQVKATQWNERLSFVKDIQGIRTDAFLQTLKGHNDEVTALAFSPNGETLASKSVDKTLRCWDIATGALKRTIQCHDDEVSAIAFSPDNRVLLLATYGNPMLGMDTKRSEKEIAKGDDYWITYIPLSPDSGMPEAVRGNRMVRLNGRSPVNEGYCNVTAFTFSSDCKTLASGSNSGLIQLWDATTGICRQTVKGHDYRVRAIAISPDGSKLASGCRQKLRLCDAATGAPLKEFHWQDERLRAIVFCQDSKKLLLGIGLGSSKLYDPAMGTLVPTSMGELNSVIAISPDNKILASASVEMRLWDATMGMQEKYGILRQGSAGEQSRTIGQGLRPGKKARKTIA